MEDKTSTKITLEIENTSYEVKYNFFYTSFFLHKMGIMIVPAMFQASHSLSSLHFLVF